MNDKPAISILMANYNGAAFLPAAIESLQKQTLTNWELIVVDDVSKDDSVAIANAFAAADPRVKAFVQERNGGPGAARNRALAEACGVWVAVFDSDDLMTPDRLQTLLDRAERDQAAIVADNQCVFYDGRNDTHLYLSGSYATEPHWVDLAQFIDSNRLYSKVPNLGLLKPLMRREAIVAAGLRYDERLRIGEDYDFMARLLGSGHRIRTEPKALYWYRKHPNSISHRIKAAEIEALMLADERLAADLTLDASAQKALARRRKSLCSMLSYDNVVNLIKGASYGRAAAIAIANPHMWPLLTQPIKARWDRLTRA
jgi:succinoglycan biosynthesis protein ExoO